MAFVGTDIFVPSGSNLENYFSLMTNGASVRLSLERGGTFGGDVRYSQAGGTADLPHIITAAASPAALPLPVLTGEFQIGIQATPITGLTVKNLAFTGRGPKVLGSGSHLKLTGLVVTGGYQGITVEAEAGLRWTNVKINKCRVLDMNQPSGDHAQGVYCFACDNLRIVDNVFDHAVAPLDVFCHHAYIQNGCTGVIVDRNIFSRSSSHALQLRPGGEASYNLVINCPIGILGGGGTHPEDGGVTINIHDNLVLGGGDIDPATPRGWGYYLENVKGGSLHNNLALDGVGGDKRGLTKDCSIAGVDENNQPTVMVGVLNANGANYHKNHPTVHTDAGPSTGTVVSWNQVPVTGTDVSMTGLGISYDKIRAGTVVPELVIQLAKQLLGLSTPKETWIQTAVKRAQGLR